MNKKYITVCLVILSAQSLGAYHIIKENDLNKNSRIPFIGHLDAIPPKTDASLGLTTTNLENIENNPQIKLSEQTTYDILLAEIALSRGENEVAYQGFLDAAKMTQDPSLAKKATEIAITHFDLNLAQHPAQLWAKTAPKDPSAQITSAAIFFRLNDNAQASEYLQKVLQISPDDADRYFVSLYSELPQGDEQEQVISELLLLQKQYPQAISTYISLGEIYLDKGLTSTGINQIEGALNINPNEPRSILIYAELLHQKGNDKEALALLKDKSAQFENNAALKLYYVEFLIENQEFELAKEELTSFKNMKSISSSTLMDLARISMKQEWYDLAQEYLLKLQTSPKDQDIARYFLGRIHEVEKDYPGAISWYKKVQDGKFHITAYIRGAWLLNQGNRVDDAIAMLESAEPQTLEDMKNLSLAKADLYSSKQEIDTAFNIITNALGQIPQDNDLLLTRSVLAHNLKDFTTAEEDLKTIINQDPQNIEALNLLGFLLADSTNRFEESLIYLKRANELSPNNAAVMDSMGWLQFKMGNHQMAIKWLEEAYRKRPDNNTAARLSQALYSQGKPERANNLLTEALKRTPDDALLKSTLEQIKK